MTTAENSTATCLDVDRILQQAIALHQNGNLHEAERLYRTVLQTDPLHPDVNHNLGVLFAQADQAGAGLPFFKTALEASPWIAQYWLSYIDALIQAGQHCHALHILEDGIRQGLAGEAVDVLASRLTAPSPDEINSLVALFNQGNHSEGETLAALMTERFPQHGFGWKVLGAVLMEQGRTTEALTYMQKAAELLPMDAEAHSNLGNAQRVLGQFFESEASCRRALEANPAFAGAHLNMGNTLADLRRLSEAEASYIKALEIKPDFVEAKIRLDLIQKELARLSEAEAGIRAAGIALNSGDNGDRAEIFDLLDFCRKHKDKGVGKLVALVGGLVFLAGMMLMWDRIDPGRATTPSYAVKVNENEISMTTFNSNYARNRELNRKQFAAAFTPEAEARLAIRKATLDALVNNELFFQAAVRQGFKVSNEEVIQSIASMPVFQKNGTFDLALYNQTLKSNGKSPKQFEDMQRQDMLAEKARRAVINSVQITDQELKDLYHKERDLIVLSYAAVTPADVWSAVTVSRAEREEFFEKNKILFMSPEKVAISYIRLAINREKLREPVRPEEIEAYYTKNMERYQKSGEGALPLKRVSDRVLRDLKREKTVKILLEKAADARFKNVSQADLQSASDYLGVPARKSRMFTATAPPSEFVGENDVIKKIFALREGEIGGPFETADAVYLVQLSGRQLPAPASFPDVSNLVENRVHTEKAVVLSKIKAEEALQNLSRSASPPHLRETAAFSYNAEGRIPGIGVFPELMEEACLLAPTGATAKKIYGSAAGWYAVRLKRRIPASEEGFEGQKAELMKRIAAVKQQRAVETWLAEQRDTAKIEVNKQIVAAIDKENNANASRP